MFNVVVEKVNDVLVTTSNRVADELGVNHKDLLAKIDNYSKKFNSAELFAQFYILSNYKALNGRKVKNYLITKKGIAQLIGGYNLAVEKAFELNIAYINRFEEMEKKLQKKEQLAISFQADDFEKDIIQLKAKANAIKREILERRFILDEKLQLLEKTGLTNHMDVYRANGKIYVCQDI